MSFLEQVIGVAVLGVVATFVVAYRWVGRRFGAAAVPAASVVAGSARWMEGRGRARLVGKAEVFQRVAIALGLTSVVVMIACLIAMIALAVVARM
jgi:hypothetical protein